jgi:copper chaperone CopZ
MFEYEDEMRTWLVGLVLTISLAVACERAPAGDAEKPAAKQPAAAPAAKPAEAPTPTALANPPGASQPAAAPAADHCGGAALMAEGESCGMPGSGCNQWDEAAAKVKRDAPGDAIWITYSVQGMHCGGCERRIIANVGELDGVMAVEADAELGKVRVAAAAGKNVEAAARERILSLGYRVQ